MDSLSQQVSNHSGPAFVFAAPQQNNTFDIWGVLSRRKWLVFLGLVAGLALGGLFNAQCEPTYRSEAKVKIEPRKSTVVHITNTSPVAPLQEDFEMRHDRLIGEYNIVNKCLDENNLMNYRSFNDMSKEEVIEYVRDNLVARPDRDEPSLYSLKFYSRDRNEVSTILNKLIHTYRTELDHEYKQESSRYRELLSDVDAKFNKGLAELQEQLRTVQQEYDAPTLGPNLNLHEHSLVRIGAVMEESQKRVNEWEGIVHNTLNALAVGPDAANSFYYSLVQSGYIKDYSGTSREGGQMQLELQLISLLAQKANLETQFGAGHSSMIAIDNQIKRTQQLQRDMQKENPLVASDPMVALQRVLSMYQQKIEIEQETLARAAEQWAEHHKEATRLTQVQQRIDTIKQAIERTEGLVRDIARKVIESDPQMQISSTRHDEGFNFKIIEPARPGKQSWPILPLILSIGGLLGLLSGFGLGCLVELADKTFHNPDEIVKQLNVPLIGHIPVIGQNKRFLVENSLIEPVVCTYHRPKSQVAEAFRAVRTSLFFNTQGKQHSVIQITSPTPGDGKSTLAANLAVSIAQAGKRVLLVDADMRRPRQATTFGITSKTGFATVLNGESDWHDVLYDCTEIEGLTVMPCGAKPYNPAELSSSPQVKELIEEMRVEFDFVIIDTPPLLAVTDACPIAARVDGVILCIRIKKNVRVSADRATEMLQNLGANCIGLVVNGVGAQSGYGSQYTYGAYRAGYSYNGYGYGYGYGYGAGKYYEDDKPTATPPTKAPRRLEDQTTSTPPS